MIIMNAAEGEKYSTFVPRLANKHDLNASRDNLLPFEKLNTPTLNLDLGKDFSKYKPPLSLFLQIQMNALDFPLIEVFSLSEEKYLVFFV